MDAGIAQQPGNCWRHRPGLVFHVYFLNGLAVCFGCPSNAAVMLGGGDGTPQERVASSWSDLGV